MRRYTYSIVAILFAWGLSSSVRAAGEVENLSNAPIVIFDGTIKSFEFSEGPLVETEGLGKWPAWAGLIVKLRVRNVIKGRIENRILDVFLSTNELYDPTIGRRVVVVGRVQRDGLIKAYGWQFYGGELCFTPEDTEALGIRDELRELRRRRMLLCDED